MLDLDQELDELTKENLHEIAKKDEAPALVKQLAGYCYLALSNRERDRKTVELADSLCRALLFLVVAAGEEPAVDVKHDAVDAAVRKIVQQNLDLKAELRRLQAG